MCPVGRVIQAAIQINGTMRCVLNYKTVIEDLQNDQCEKIRRAQMKNEMQNEMKNETQNEMQKHDLGNKDCKEMKKIEKRCKKIFAKQIIFCELNIACRTSNCEI